VCHDFAVRLFRKNFGSQKMCQERDSVVVIRGLLLKTETEFDTLQPSIRNDFERSLATYQMERQGA
jgi:hypothetical protein